MTKIPSHTSRHFAEQAYRGFLHTGRTQFTSFKTVAGIPLVVTVSTEKGAVLVTWPDGYKVEPIRKSWAH